MWQPMCGVITRRAAPARNVPISSDSSHTRSGPHCDRNSKNQREVIASPRNRSSLALGVSSGIPWAPVLAEGCTYAEGAGTSFCLVVKVVLLTARWAGRGRRLALTQAAKAADDGAAPHLTPWSRAALVAASAQ